VRKQHNKFEWMKKCEETAVLLLEGSDDCHIIKEFCQKNEIKPNFGFCKCGSDNQVLSRLNALLKKSEKPNILGVILDADKDVNARYQNNIFLFCLLYYLTDKINIYIGYQFQIKLF
jgi:hypothetical protein